MDIFNRVLLTSISVISCLDSFWRPLSVNFERDYHKNYVSRCHLSFLGLSGGLSKIVVWSLMRVPPLCHFSTED